MIIRLLYIDCAVHFYGVAVEMQPKYYFIMRSPFRFLMRVISTTALFWYLSSITALYANVYCCNEYISMHIMYHQTTNLVKVASLVVIVGDCTWFL